MKTIVLFDQNDSTFFRNDICIILRGLTIPKKHTINIESYTGISFQKEIKESHSSKAIKLYDRIG